MIIKEIIHFIHIADIFAIPCFMILVYYFYSKKSKTKIEYFLYAFAIIGLILDMLFSIYVFKNQKLF